LTFIAPARATPILQDDEPHPLEVINAQGRSDFFLICEHAGRLIPRLYGDMGLSDIDRERHIAWDIGARQVGLELAALLDAPLFTQRYSRLVCDCNRRPDVTDFAPARSEDTDIPANIGIDDTERAARAAEIFWPFHDAVNAALDARAAAGKRTLLVTIHSFTPVFRGVSRPWEVGVLYNRDRAFSRRIADWLKENTEFCVGVNQPYSVGDESDYAIPVHGEKRGLPCVEFEIRHDLIRTPENARRWAELLAKAILAVAPTLDA
jgi:predicted N-formylglutamate amidohydrolase